jgi:uncharacterized protein YqjF (DUF2071 family)
MRWLMAQRWERLLFAHWAVDPDRLRGLVPTAVELDTHDGAAWLTVTPHRIAGVRFRGAPALPTLSRMLEVSVRTYVVGRRPGVVFLSLDTDSRVGAWVARQVFGIEYVQRPLSLRESGEAVEFESPRFRVSYAPAGEPFLAEPGTLDHFLVERPCLFTPSGGRVDVDCDPWWLCAADARIGANTMAPAGIELGEPDLIRLCARQEVRLSSLSP